MVELNESKLTIHPRCPMLRAMNRSPNHLLSTFEAAVLTGVGPSTIKRWADQGLLPCARTAGGHRRFDKRAVLALADAQQNPTLGRSPGEVWVDRLIHEGPHAIEASLLDLRAEHGTWAATADAFAPVLQALGEAWSLGKISVLQEHVASERLSRVLARLAGAVPVPLSAPTALLATATGDAHTLGLHWVEVVLREAGWNVLWAGRGTPAGDIAEAVLAGAAQMVALSASVWSSDQRNLADDLVVVASACIETGALLVLGGKGAWPQTPIGIARIDHFSGLSQLAVLERGRGRVRAAGLA
jgi:excisionase family DNA binding protein